MTIFKFRLTALVLLFTITAGYSQLTHCGSMQHLEFQKQQDPGIEARMATMETQLQQQIATQRTSSMPLVIRVVVHVVWNTAAQNISDTQILSQIDVLNEDYSRTNTDAINTPAVFLAAADAPDIHFCLASEDPNGNPTNGIVRVQTITTSFNTNDNVKFDVSGGSDAWDPNSYLNIWVCNLSPLLGYAQLPGGNSLTSGAVLHYSAFGRTGNVMAPYNLGRNATHEIGHVFNLRHIWGDATCGNDLVTDTPVQSTSNFGCPTLPHITCSNGPNGDMFMNYMDYSDDACLNLFTAGQVTRMRASIMVNYPGLISNIDCVPIKKPIAGNVFYDLNQDGTKDTSETGMIGRTVLLLPDSILMTSASTGNYSSVVDSGLYSVEIIPDPLWNITTPSSYSVQIDSTASCCNNFGLYPLVSFDDLSINFTSMQLRCGFDVPSFITATNTGTTILSGQLRFIPDNLMIFISSIPQASATSGDTLFFDYTNLFPGQSINLSFLYEIPQTAGIVLCMNSTASVFNGVSNQVLTENLFCDTITCSFDPNDKQVIPNGVQLAHYILKTDSLLYTIRFQNEGTDTAFTVILRDQLSGFLDRNTIELISSSHPVTLFVDAFNLAEFHFDNILLPQKAINEPGSNGFVKFRILPLPNLPDGTVIDNSAGIYFDYNAPVITNNTFVTLVTTIPVGINEIAAGTTLSVSPQPFSDLCEISFTSDYEGAATYTVYDIAGRKMKEGTSTEGKRKVIRLFTADWSKGMYFIHISGNGGEANTKLLKQ